MRARSLRLLRWLLFHFAFLSGRHESTIAPARIVHANPSSSFNSPVSGAADLCPSECFWNGNVAAAEDGSIRTSTDLLAARDGHACAATIPPSAGRLPSRQTTLRSQSRTGSGGLGFDGVRGGIANAQPPANVWQPFRLPSVGGMLSGTPVPLRTSRQLTRDAAPRSGAGLRRATPDRGRR